MKQVINLLSCLFALNAFAQPDTTADKNLQLGYTDISKESHLLNPAFIVKGDDIRRFPTLNFLEAVNGLFPWVFSFEPDTNDFLYVVDGNILADVNAISLYDIEEVAFIRGGLETGNYPFAKRGCFIIRTKSKSGKSSFEFNTNAGFHFLKSGRPFSIDHSFARYDSAAAKSFFQNYQLSYGGKVGKASYYVSGNFTYDKNPPVDLHEYRLQDTANYKYKLRTTMSRFHAGASIPLLPVLRLDIQGIAAIQTGKSYSANVFSDGFIHTNGDLPDRYYTVLSSLNWKISNAFSNKLSFSYSDDKEKQDLKSVAALPTGVYNVFANDTNKVKRGLLENNTSYRFNSDRGFGIKAGLLIRYNFENLRKGHTGIVYQNDQLYSAELSFSKRRMRLITALPYFNLDYKNFISLYGGVQIIVEDLEAEGNLAIKNSSKRLPYGGAVFSLMNLSTQKKFLNRLDLGIHYSERNSNQTDYYRLEKQKLPDQFFPASVYILSSNDDFCKDKILSLQATAGFSQDRFLIGAEWSKSKEEKFFIYTIPSFPPTQIAVLGEVETKGFSFFGQAQVLKSEKSSWNIRFNGVKQDLNNSVTNSTPQTFYPLTMGVQNNISIRDFFVQLNAVMGFNKEYRVVPGTFIGSSKTDDISLNHVLLGYRLSLNKTWLSNMQAFIQAKNILATKDRDSYYDWAKYVGVGLNISL